MSALQSIRPDLRARNLLQGAILLPKHALFPPEFRAAAERLNMSPAIVSGDHIFLTGTTGSDAHGHMPDDPETQFRSAFDKIGLVLRAGDLTFDAIVEMTTYHI